ncbi:MAG: glycosyltransferase [Pseudomonadota bacterium]
MDKLHLGIVFDLNKNWIGGGYYIRNVLKALKLLPDEERPHISIITENYESFAFLAEAEVPNMIWLKRSQVEARASDYPLDVTFPWPIKGIDHKAISWIPDFQDMQLPAFFSEMEREGRIAWHENSFKTGGLILSSQAALADVERFYPGRQQPKAVVPFATFDTFPAETAQDTIERYGLRPGYVMSPNQFWIHKNHLVVLEAVRLLKRRGVEPHVIFTGHTFDHRAKAYPRYIEQQIRRWKLQDNIQLMGFLPRADQLAIMSGASYVLQPSLFEGWSTVIEDAKSMQQFVLASDLDIHREQLDQCFAPFKACDPESLAHEMEKLHEAPPDRSTLNYAINQKAFAYAFKDALTTMAHAQAASQSAALTMADVQREHAQNIEDTDKSASHGGTEDASTTPHPTEEQHAPSGRVPLDRSALKTAKLLFDANYVRQSNPGLDLGNGEELKAFVRSPHAHRIQPSPFLLPDWYRDQHQWTDERTPLEHFLMDGQHKGLPSHPLFHADFYRQRHLPARISTLQPFLHYLKLGIHRGYQPGPFFDPEFYAAQQGFAPGRRGLAEAGRHFWYTGLAENLQPCEFFDPYFYALANGLNLKTDGSMLLHYLTAGIRTNAPTHPGFDCDFYLQAYPEAAYGNTPPLIHYLTSGREKGYLPKSPAPEAVNQNVPDGTDYYARKLAAKVVGP